MPKPIMPPVSVQPDPHLNRAVLQGETLFFPEFPDSWMFKNLHNTKKTLRAT